MHGGICCGGLVISSPDNSATVDEMIVAVDPAPGVVFRANSPGREVKTVVCFHTNFHGICILAGVEVRISIVDVHFGNAGIEITAIFFTKSFNLVEVATEDYRIDVVAALFVDVGLEADVVQRYAFA